MKRKQTNLRGVNVDRLDKLADLLLSDPYRCFEYRIDSSSLDKSRGKETWFSMQTIDVIISESIHVFPDDWCWLHKNEIAFYKNDVLKNPTTSAMIFYNLDIYMVTHLFVPFRQSPHYFGGTTLEMLIRPEQVGNNIRDFIKTHNSILN